MDVSKFEDTFFAKISTIASNDDPAHDLLHFQRVVKMAKALCFLENAKKEVVIPAAWLHDFVIVPKNDPRRSKASQLSADAAIEFLKEIGYPEEFHADIAHAIAAHSFSANIEPKTLEAKIVQDADRLDGLGSIGIARCFATSGILKRSFYSQEDPFCVIRPPDDKEFALDHFYEKLFKTAETLQTEEGREEGKRRVEAMKIFLDNLKTEIG